MTPHTVETHITPELRTHLLDLKDSGRHLTVLTGAGVSAESGVPTFRGPDGYWTVGSIHYQPQEIGTHAMLQRQPRDVWRWFLYRRGVCRRARPNAGHKAIARMERILPERFDLITQNVDGLHLKAGSSVDQTHQVHGNIHLMRCAGPCADAVHPIPEEIPPIAREEDLPEPLWGLLTCPRCGGITRPHVLLWDESYNEQWYRFQTSLTIAARTDLLIVVGTTGATRLPMMVVAEVLRRIKPVVVIDIAHNIFAEMALASAHGWFLPYPSATILPLLADILAD